MPQEISLIFYFSFFHGPFCFWFFVISFPSTLFRLYFFPFLEPNYFKGNYFFILFINFLYMKKALF